MRTSGACLPAEEDLKRTDEREKGYKRVEIKFENIIDFSSQIEENAKYWVYVNTFENNEIPPSVLPSKDFPIVQPYVDICVNGCIEIEESYPKAKQWNFAVNFIKSTHLWSKFWVNDRIYPRRPFIYRPTAYQIDSLLKENLPDKDLFNHIYFE